VKPVKADELQIAIIKALRTAAQPDPAQALTPAARTEKQAAIATSIRPLRILLAEDNPVNRRVAMYMLAKAGHSVFAVANGRDAITALANERFDLVLMDVQMPEMDGLEATSAIRAKERQTGEHIPIVAMTAHAMKGDRERCLQEGMDGYVSKPVHSSDLLRAIDAFAPRPTTEPKAAPSGANADVVFAMESALAGVHNNDKALNEMILGFLASAPKRMEEIYNAVERRDAKRTQRAARCFKGSLKWVGAQAAAAAADRLEAIGKGADLSQFDTAFDDLACELDRLTAATSKLLAERTTAAT
jgi:CheY-like chemotaxis protein/HPt (histidine-containing phosphotransfer) domain-containing protein